MSTTFNFSEILATATNATNGNKEIYNYQGKILSGLVDKTGSTQKARKTFRKILEKIALQFSNVEKAKKADFAKGIWQEISDNFNSKIIAKDSRLNENKHLAEFQKAINNL